MAGVVLERRRRRPVAAAQIAVALSATDRVVELPADFQGLGTAAAARRTAELDRLRPLGRIGEERRECLDVGQHIAPLAIGEPSLPARHRRAERPFIYRPHPTAAGGELPPRRPTTLMDRTGK